jgi:two-component system response regulator AlgR
VASVVYCKAELKYVTLRTLEREFIIEEPLVSLEREFADAFLRIHRNCLVARAAISGFERAPGGSEDESHWEVLLDGVAERLPVSRRQWTASPPQMKGGRVSMAYGFLSGASLIDSIQWQGDLNKFARRFDRVF